MQKLKSVMLAVFAGVLVGGAVSDLVGPSMLEWYNIPGGGQALCNCADIVHSTANSVIKWHWIGGLAGGLAFGIASLAFGIGRGRSDKTAARGSTPPA